VEDYRRFEKEERNQKNPDFLNFLLQKKLSDKETGDCDFWVDQF
jgi:hypothetical protein